MVARPYVRWLKKKWNFIPEFVSLKIDSNGESQNSKSIAQSGINIVTKLLSGSKNIKNRLLHQILFRIQ